MYSTDYFGTLFLGTLAGSLVLPRTWEAGTAGAMAKARGPLFCFAVHPRNASLLQALSLPAVTFLDHNNTLQLHPPRIPPLHSLCVHQPEKKSAWCHCALSASRGQTWLPPDLVFWAAEQNVTFIPARIKKAKGGQLKGTTCPAECQQGAHSPARVTREGGADRLEPGQRLWTMPPQLFRVLLSFCQREWGRAKGSGSIPAPHTNREAC